MFETSTNDCLAVEQINDLVYAAAEPGEILYAALQITLENLHCSSGAIYMPGYGPQSEWVSHKTPPSWRSACMDENSQLSGLVRRALYQTIPMPGVESLQIGSILPLTSASNVIGVVLVGAPTAETTGQRWQAYLRALARIAYLHKKNNTPSASPKETEMLRILSEAQNMIHDPDQMAFQMTSGIRDIFQAEDSLLILLDEESPDLAICKRIGMEGQRSGIQQSWLSQYSIRLGSKIAQWMLSEDHILTIDDIYSEPELELLFHNEPNLQVDTLTCSPLKGNSGQTIGVLILVNPPLRTMDDQQSGLLATAAGSLANLIHTTRLITLLKISNADLEALRWELINSRNTLRALFDSLPSSVYIVDQVYNLVAINSSRSMRVNKHPNTLVGRKCYEQLHDRMEPCKGCLVAETLRSGHNLQWSNREWSSADNYTEWDVKTFSIQENADKATRAIVVEEDVSTQRALETSLAQSEKMAIIGQLAAGIAHEIHNPLTAILANAQILGHCIPNNQVDWRDSIELIEAAGKDIFQVAQNLLGMAEKGKYEFLPCDLNDTLFNAQRLVQHELKNHQVSVRMSLEEKMPQITVSKDHIQDVWINLFLNAIHSLDKDQKWIDICSYYENGWYHLIFQDNGRGIPAERIESLFNPSTPGKKQGLNLYNCKKVIRQHGGSIEVESKVGEWTRFTVTLPAQSSEMVMKERSRVKEFELSGIR